jgi:hypothetical protein
MLAMVSPVYVYAQSLEATRCCAAEAYLIEFHLVTRAAKPANLMRTG